MSDTPPTAPTTQSNTGKRRFLIFGGLIAVVAIYGGFHWYTNRYIESTDDAFVDGDAGLIAPRISGTVLAVHVADNQRVHAGDLVMELDSRDEKVALAQATAQLESAKANLTAAQAQLDLTQATVAATLDEATSGLASAEANISAAIAQANSADALQVRAQADVERARVLARTNDASKQALDAAIATADSSKAQAVAAHEGITIAKTLRDVSKGKLAEAQTGPQQIAAKQAATAQAKAAVDTAQAAVDSAALQLSYTKITAPRDGSITQRSFNVGDQVQRGETIANLVFTNPWVTANFKETQVSHMRAGQPVTIAIDSLGGQTFKGHVDSVMRGTGARFALLPTENATGNYVKVVQRVPVKIVFDDLPPETAATLGLGFSVVPRVNVESP